jgi:hypothetical protein
MNIPDHISESLETIFWVINTSSMRIRDPESGMEKFGSGIRDEHPGSATLLHSDNETEFHIIKGGFPAYTWGFRLLVDGGVASL